MALIKCPECGNWISDQASACPHCGYSENKNKYKKRMSEVKNKINNIKSNRKLVISAGCCVAGVVFICFVPVLSKAWKQAQHATQVKNDKISPQLTYIGDGITITQGESITENQIKTDLKASDNVTSADKLIYKIPVSSIDTDIEEETILTCTVQDEAGNVSSVDVPITIASRYTDAEKLKYIALCKAIVNLKDRLKDPNSLDILGMGWDGKKCAYLYYSARNSFGGMVSGYCEYDTSDQSFYAPGATAEGWEIRFVQRRYESSQKVSMDELEEFQAYY